MANVVRDPREHPDAIIPDLATKPSPSSRRIRSHSFTAASGSSATSRKLATTIFRCRRSGKSPTTSGASISCRERRDWWAPFYPPDNMQRPTGPTCDGCHSVGYDIHTKQVAEWNVGCERCHGPGSEHAAHPSRGNILNPAHMDYVAASDTCIQCHSQGRPRHESDRGEILRLAGGLQRGAPSAGFLETGRSHAGRLTFTISPTALRTKIACRETTSCRA